MTKRKKENIIYKESFTARLKKAREQTGLTQQEVSDLIQMNRSQLSQYETGFVEPNLKMLAKLSIVYGVSLDWLLARGGYNGEPDYKNYNNDMIIKIDFPNRIRKERANKNISQAKLAKATKIPNSTIAKYELGQLEPNLEKLGLLADYFKVSLDYLLGIAQ